LKFGVVQASGLIRTLQTNNSLTRLARALAELGASCDRLAQLRGFDSRSEIFFALTI
jgi:hypothetical protein